MYNVCKAELLLYCTEMAYMCTCKPRMKYPEYCTCSYTYLLYLPPCTIHLILKLFMLRSRSTAPPYLLVLHKLAYMTVELSPGVHDGVQVAGFPCTAAYMISTKGYMVVHDWHPGCMLYYICSPPVGVHTFSST